MGRRTTSICGLLIALCCGCGSGESRARAPRASSPPNEPASASAGNAIAVCPQWTPFDAASALAEESRELHTEQLTALMKRALDQGEVVRAATLANAATIRCREETVRLDHAATTRLSDALVRVRVALDAPKSGDEYVTEARERAAAGDAKGARAAWDWALLAYRRETGEQGLLAALRDTPEALALNQQDCAPQVQLEHPTQTRLRVRAIGDTGELYWELEAADGNALFAGRASYVKAVTNDAWLRSGADVDFMRANGAAQHLGKTRCGAVFRVFGDWLIGSAGGHAHAIDLAHPERSFSHKLRLEGDVQATRVGRYIEIWQDTPDGHHSLVIFRPDASDPYRTAWRGAKLPAQDQVRLYDVPRWGAVLVTRETVIFDERAHMGFQFDISAKQLETGRRLALITMPASVRYSPGMTLDPRHGLIAIGEAWDARIAALGSATSRKLSVNPVIGEVEDIAVTKDGLVCTAQVEKVNRNYSCALRVTADLAGGGRHRAKNRFCLGSSEGAWSGVVAPEPGRAHIESEGTTVVTAVCGQRLAPDGASAAFIETKPRASPDEAYADAELVLVDTKTGHARWHQALPGETELSYAFIDLAFSPSGAYVASLFGHQVSVYRVSDGARLGAPVAVNDLNWVVWLDQDTFSGGNSQSPVLSVESGTLHELGALPKAPGDLRCVFGGLLTPREVCSSLAAAAPKPSRGH